VLAGAAVQRFGGKVKDEQETLIALADVAIASSRSKARCCVRRRSPPPGTSPARSSPPRRQGVRVPGVRGGDQRGAPRRVLRRRGEHAADAPLRDPEATRYDASGLLDAKRKLAARPRIREVPFLIRSIIEKRSTRGVPDEEARARAVAPAAVVAIVRAGRRRVNVARRFPPARRRSPQRGRHPHEAFFKVYVGSLYTSGR